MNGRGYHPQGHRPEPTTAPATPAPCTPAADHSVEAHADMSAQLASFRTFLRARAAQAPVVDPRFHELLGYAVGYAEACMDKQDIVGAVRKLEWMRNEAARWSTHPEHPDHRNEPGRG
ncbi:hypothetical protein ACWGH2_42155 [Streptomyces sp. NPDC054871]